jgi:hypothetical protein
VRWRILLRVQGIQVSWIAALRQLLTAIFFNLYTPALIGGDAVRFLYLAGDHPDRKPAALSTIVMDRIVGLISLLTLCAAALVLRYSWLTQTAAAGRLVRITGLSLLGAMLFAAATFTAVRCGLRLPKRFPVAKGLSVALESLRAFARQPKACWLALFTTLAAHLLYYLVFYCAARAIDHGRQALGVFDIFSIMPIVNTLVSLPISISGIGVREVTFETLLSGRLGADSSIAPLIATTGFLAYAFWGVLGGLLFMAYPPRQARGCADSEGNCDQRSASQT